MLSLCGYARSVCYISVICMTGKGFSVCDSRHLYQRIVTSISGNCLTILDHLTGSCVAETVVDCRCVGLLILTDC